jgi:hypothetical protein
MLCSIEMCKEVLRAYWCCVHQKNLGLIFGIFSGLSKDPKALKDQKMHTFEKILMIFSSRVHCLSETLFGISKISPSFQRYPYLP